MKKYDYLENTHDLTLSDWGPYTKKYMGISHVTDQSRGIRFDVSISPAMYRYKVAIPDSRIFSDYYPLAASADLTYYKHRHSLVNKNDVYADIEFCVLNDQEVLSCMTLVNNTDLPQNLALNFLAGLEYHPIDVARDIYYNPITLNVDTDDEWLDGTDLLDYLIATKTCKDKLQPDGRLYGEIVGNYFINGKGLQSGFARHVNDSITYKINENSKDYKYLTVRYLASNNFECEIKLSNGYKQSFMFKASKKKFVEVIVPIDIDGSVDEMKIIAKTPCETFVLDGFRLSNKNNLLNIQSPKPMNVIPKYSIRDNSVVLKYDSVDKSYGIAWSPEYESVVRELITNNPKDLLEKKVHNHVNTVLYGDGEGHSSNIFVRPIFLEEKSTTTIYSLIVQGEQSDVEKSIGLFNNDLIVDNQWLNKTLEGFRGRTKKFDFNDAGRKYEFSQNCMIATLMCNIVFPVRTCGGFIKHHTPGRNWDSLYTWDSGFIGIGMQQIDSKRAIENLNAYVTSDSENSAFIHHGSPVPVQHYLFQEIINSSDTDKELEFFYDKLLRYHNFLMGKEETSSTNKLKSNLLQTWDYFYNSGGWDDYPPQMHIHKTKQEAASATVVNSAHAIRTAKILILTGQKLAKDVSALKEDVRILSESLQENSWDSKDGYFGYVMHDKGGNPVEILRHESGFNYNMGLGGVYPLVSGICTKEQEQILVEKLFSENHMWTPYGLSTVDKSAPWYSESGYWNGAIWMPHQWFVWKALLDYGHTEKARKLAITALELWKKEVDASYNCFEHFTVKTGRGAGWHHFGGLSTPVLAWFKSYFVKGSLTLGFDAIINTQKWSLTNDSLEADVKFYDDRKSKSCIAVMDENKRYIVKFNGQQLEYNEPYKGTLEFCLSGVKGKLEIYED